MFQKKCTFCGGTNHSAEKYFKIIRKDKVKALAVSDLGRQQTEHTPYKFFRCGTVDHLIYNCPKPPKYNEKRWKTIRFNERGNSPSQRESDKGDYGKNQKIYASMALMSGNHKGYSRDFSDSLQLTNWILDSRSTCHMTPQD